MTDDQEKIIAVFLNRVIEFLQVQIFIEDQPIQVQLIEGLPVINVTVVLIKLITELHQIIPVVITEVILQ